MDQACTVSSNTQKLFAASNVAQVLRSAQHISLSVFRLLRWLMMKPLLRDQTSVIFFWTGWPMNLPSTRFWNRPCLKRLNSGPKKTMFLPVNFGSPSWIELARSLRRIWEKKSLLRGPSAGPIPPRALAGLGIAPLASILGRCKMMWTWGSRINPSSPVRILKSF